MRVAVLDDYHHVALEVADWSRVRKQVDVRVFSDHLTEEEDLAERLQDFDGVVVMRERTPLGRTLLARLPKLRLLVTTGGANATIDLGAATEHGIQVCATRSLVYPTSELTWGLILGSLRHIPREDRLVREGRWQTTLGTGVSGKVLGIVGLGRLGAMVARVGLALDMRVIAWSQNLTAARAVEQGARLVAKDALFAEADVVTVHTVLSERTRNLVGRSELARMKPTAIIVNTSRGPIIDETALVEALREKRIAGAALDVFDHEPLPAGHPLLNLDNVILTPHIGYVTIEAYRAYYGDVVENIEAWLAGTVLRPLNALS